MRKRRKSQRRKNCAACYDELFDVLQIKCMYILHSRAETKFEYCTAQPKPKLGHATTKSFSKWNVKRNSDDQLDMVANLREVVILSHWIIIEASCLYQVCSVHYQAQLVFCSFSSWITDRLSMTLCVTESWDFSLVFHWLLHLLSLSRLLSSITLHFLLLLIFGSNSNSITAGTPHLIILTILLYTHSNFPYGSQVHKLA